MAYICLSVHLSFRNTFLSAPYFWTLWKIFIKLWSNVRISESMCRTHKSTIPTQGHRSRWWGWPLNFVSTPYLLYPYPACIVELWVLTLFSRSLHHKYSKRSLVNEVKSLCAQYLFIQWPWPYFQGHYTINAQKTSLVNAVKSVHIISLTNGWNLIKLAQIHHQDVGKKWLDFGDLDFIFKVTTL